MCMIACACGAHGCCDTDPRMLPISCRIPAFLSLAGACLVGPRIVSLVFACLGPHTDAHVDLRPGGCVESRVGMARARVGHVGVCGCLLSSGLYNVVVYTLAMRT